MNIRNIHKRKRNTNEMESHFLKKIFALCIFKPIQNRNKRLKQNKEYLYYIKHITK